tara:strand:+ start:6427 stop:6678 length:252 start_codon:yes stop_codon:yes gene_type:complete
MDNQPAKSSYTPAQKKAIDNYRQAERNIQKIRGMSRESWNRWYQNEENKKRHNKSCLERYYRKKEEAKKQAIALQETLAKSPF